MSSFSTHRGNKYILNFCQTQDKINGQFIEFEKKI